MRMMMTPHEILDGLLNSDAMDDLVAYRLRLSLETSIETLERLSKLSDLSPYQYEDFTDTLRYARALTTVLEWFTTDEMLDTLVELNRYSLRLEMEATEF